MPAPCFVLLTGLSSRVIINANKGLRRGFAPDPTRVLNTLDPLLAK